jgi:predicted ArsR family transcriptional regulator
MHGTRERILELVIERREQRVEDLAGELGITQAAVRRHLDNLRADGLVGARAVRQATGRPYHAYYPTERATEAAASSYTDLLERMLVGLGGREDVVSIVANSVAEALASRHQAEMGDGANDPEARVTRVTESLRPEGILESWHTEDDGFHLMNSTCPYRKAAEVSPLPCESDRKAIEMLLGISVEQLNRIVDGSPVCEYLVRAVRGPQTSVSAQGAS